MNHTLARSILLLFAASAWSSANETVALVQPPETLNASAPASSPPAATSATLELEAKENQQKALEVENKLQAELLTHETNRMRAEITRLKLERELMLEKLEYESAKRQVAAAAEMAKIDAEKEKLARDSALAKARAEKLASELKAMEGQASLELSRLKNEIAAIETAKKRSQYSDSQPVYLKNPLREDGIVVISDRRIPLNGVITTRTADFVTDRIQYWNNKDHELPIFIVIDSSPGGSVMAGYRILKAMESSSAPVHVVVKSFAASMAAAITTLAEESYAYPNAVLLHHQISSQIMGQLNLTQQREFHEESERWWARLGTPIATRMGITTDELIQKMYSHSTSGDWSEFAEDAQKLHWVKHVVSGIDETSITRDPDAVPVASKSESSEKSAVLEEGLDAQGKPFAWLPRIGPKDVYFLYNPDSYYRMR